MWLSSKGFSLFRGRIQSVIGKEIRRHPGKQLEGFGKIMLFLAQDDLIAPAQDFHLVDSNPVKWISLAKKSQSVTYL